MRRTLTFVALVCSTTVIGLQSYWLNGQTWPAGTMINEYIQLGSSPALTDGCADWSCVATGAMSRWNAYLGSVQFRAVPNATQGQGEWNGRNDIFFGTDVFGRSFGTDVLALTIWQYNSRTNTLLEADIGFNSAFTWNSYRGNQTGRTYDLRRVAIHELGHVLGLAHPDDHGQTVDALMNSRIGNRDDLAPDDIAGGQAMYGGGGGTGATINFPPRNETYDFRSWLETKYRDSLGRAPGASYTDVEGSVVWVQEYLRYRLNTCTDAQATDKVRIQINGGGVPGVCGTPVSTTTFSFPPRDQTYAFRLVLEDIYKNDLKRGTVQTTVDAEGDVVWIQEYLRYRLNGCTHAQSIDRVSLQIDGRGVQPVCK